MKDWWYFRSFQKCGVLLIRDIKKGRLSESEIMELVQTCSAVIGAVRGAQVGLPAHRKGRNVEDVKTKDVL